MKNFIRIFNYTAKNRIILFSENLQISNKKSSNLQKKISDSSSKNLQISNKKSSNLPRKISDSVTYTQMIHQPKT